jgi:hypothetical protein
VFKWGNLYILYNKIADVTLICKDMNTNSLRYECEYSDGRKVLLKHIIKMKMGNFYIYVVCALETNTCVSSDVQSRTRITQAIVLI